MSSNKKLAIIIGVLAVAIVAVLTGLIVVLVSANQNAQSVVNVKYVAEDVYVDLSATAYLAGNTHKFTENGEVDGNTVLTLSPDNKVGTLSQQEYMLSLELTKVNSEIVFEYVFINKTDDINVNIDLTNVPGDSFGETRNNIAITYAYSDTKVEVADFATLDFVSEYSDQQLNAVEGEVTTKYVYIKAKIDDLLLDSVLYGNFNWSLTRITNN